MGYRIVTDSTANMPNKLINKYDLCTLSFKYKIGDEKNGIVSEVEDEKWQNGFYYSLREKKKLTIYPPNKDDIIKVFSDILESGQDLIYLAFSSGLSDIYEKAKEAACELLIKYPERNIYVIDTLAAGLGQGLITDYVCRLKEEGKSIDEIRDWTENNKLKICHQLTVDNLFYFKRSGRISLSDAIWGTISGTKPMLHIDNEGHLVKTGKIRGRKKALTELVNRLEKNALEPKNQRIFIGHGDCIEDAKFVEQLIRDRLGVKDIEICYINPVIASYSGPGTVALYYMGTER